MYVDNPWQRIVYSALVDAGGHLIVLEDLSELLPAAADCRNVGDRPILHLNWTAPVSQSAPTVSDSAQAVTRVGAILEQFVHSGGRIVWSIHNVLPHELHHFAPEVMLCRIIADLADTIIVMNPDTADLVRPLYRLDPSKVVKIDHPSFIGEFPGETTREAARKELDLPEDAVVGIFFGLIRPYKGLGLDPWSWTRCRFGYAASARVADVAVA